MTQSRFQVVRVDGTSFQVIDTIHRAEICVVSDYQLADGQWTDDAEQRAIAIANRLYDYRPTIARLSPSNNCLI